MFDANSLSCVTAWTFICSLKSQHFLISQAAALQFKYPGKLAYVLLKQLTCHKSINHIFFCWWNSSLLGSLIPLYHILPQPTSHFSCLHRVKRPFVLLQSYLFASFCWWNHHGFCPKNPQTRAKSPPPAHRLRHGSVVVVLEAQQCAPPGSHESVIFTSNSHCYGIMAMKFESRIYPLVISYIAIENGHWNSGFSH